MSEKYRVLKEEKREGFKHPIRVQYHVEDLLVYSDKKFENTFGILDYESTDVDNSKAIITEIGLTIFSYNKETFEIGHLVKEYSELNDPEVPISAEVTYATGIDNEMVKGLKIDLSKYKEVFSNLDFIIAHNAQYDRGISERFIDTDTVYACSLNDIDWTKYNYPTRNLTDLLKYQGAYFDAHRAVFDCKATYYLLQTKAPSPHDGETFFQIMMKNIPKERYLVLAQGNTYPVKDKFRVPKMRWFTYVKPDKSEVKGYQKLVNTKEELIELNKWLEKEVYTGNKKPPITIFKVHPKDYYRSVSHIVSHCDKFILPKEKKEFVIKFKGIPRDKIRTFFARGYQYTKDPNHPYAGFVYMSVTTEEYNDEKKWAKSLLGEDVEISHSENYLKD